MFGFTSQDGRHRGDTSGPLNGPELTSKWISTGQGQNSQIDDLLRWAYAAKHELKAVAWKQRLHFGALYA
ncbi:hypothetical protein HFO69_34220 [Rhizobium laguerreae]|nr:hypothetical protein [Rhizobium laguerreae]